MRLPAYFLLALAAGAPPAWCQGNYEVQVYGSDLVPPGSTMVELHSNYTFRGTKGTVDGVLPTQDAFHETVEITHGFNEWFETGLYLFQSHQPGLGWMWVGTHLRPRFSIPDRLPAPQLFRRHVDVGAAPHRR